MRVRILKDFGGYKAGQEFDWGDGMARVLVARGVAEAAMSPHSGMAEAISEDAVERAIDESRMDRAVQQQPIKRRPQK